MNRSSKNTVSPKFKMRTLSLVLVSALRWCLAEATPWQCRPGSVDLNNIYPELVSERNHTVDIGEGTDGQIFMSESSEQIAIKRFFSDTSSDQIHDEYWIGQSLSHPNIAKTHSLTRHRNDTDDNDDDDDGYWQMEMEFVQFPLLDLLDHDVWAERAWSFSATSCVFAQLVEAVAFMHESGIAHRDLKVENVMVARNGVVKLIDFGSAAASRSALAGTRLNSTENWVGTPITMAPEVHGERFFDMEKADVWSLGVILLRLSLGVYLWEPEGVLGALADNEAFRAFLAEREDQTPDTKNGEDVCTLCQLPQVARDIVAGMLEVDPRKRLNLRTVVESQWFRDTAIAVSEGLANPEHH
ncbi:kinase-like protein, partial [Cucurbitaria berberidis CBS 394.84]